MTLCFSVIDYCKSDPCNGCGKCVGRINTFTCVCEAAFSGVTCDRGRLKRVGFMNEVSRDCNCIICDLLGSVLKTC